MDSKIHFSQNLVNQTILKLSLINRPMKIGDDVAKVHFMFCQRALKRGSGNRGGSRLSLQDYHRTPPVYGTILNSTSSPWT